VSLRGSDPFDCDGGLHCVCDVYGPGFDSEYGRVRVGWCVYVAQEDYGCRVLCPYDPALAHVASMMANGGGGDGGDAVRKKVGFSVREIDGEEGEWNVHELDCENENDEEGGRGSEKSGR
jgi:hypothetical protein